MSVLTLPPSVIHRFLTLSPHECMQTEANTTTNNFVSLELLRPRVHHILWGSGGPRIMFNQAGAFIDLIRQIRDQVTVSDGKIIPIRGFGTVALWMPDGVTYLAVLSNVLYVPD